VILKEIFGSSLESRFVGAYGPTGGHAYAEFFVPSANWDKTLRDIRSFFNSDDQISYMTGDKGNWINLD
jgi:hypothetical protein